MSFQYIKVRDVESPERAHLSDAGIDFYVPRDFEGAVLYPGKSILIQTGIKPVIPTRYAMIIKDRSGNAVKKKLHITAGVIDCNYHGEIGVHLFNFGSEPVIIKAGDKIAQGVLVPVGYDMPEEISMTDFEAITGSSDRGENGYGSTGF